MVTMLKIKQPISKSLWKEAVKSVFKDKKETFQLVQNLKKNGYKIGFLSNTETPAMEYFYDNDYEKYFDEKYPNIFSLKEFDQAMDKNDKEYIKYAPIKVLIDNLKIEGISHPDLDRKIKFVELPDSDVKIIMIKGHEIIIKIGDKELNADFSEISELKSLFSD